MKKIFYSVAMVAFSAAILASCTKSDEKEQAGQEVLVHLQMGQDTRAAFEDATGLQWSVGDHLFWKGSATSNCEYTLTAADIEGGYEASFKTVIPGLSEGDVTGWFKYNTHPNLGNDEAVFSDLNSKPFKYGTPNLSGTTLTYQQEAAGMANPAIFSLQSSGSSSSMTPQTLAQGTTEINVEMQILGTVFRVLPFTSTYSDEVIQKVTFSSMSTIAGTVEYQMAGTYRAPFWANINKIIVELDTPMALTSATDKESSKGIYFALPPTESPISGYEYVVTTDQAEYIFTSEKALAVTNNVVKNIPLNLDKAKRVTASDWPVEAYFYPTTKEKFSGMVSSISSYVVAADKKSATVVMSDHLHHGGALYFDGGFNDIKDNTVYVESFDTGLAGFGNAPGFVFNFDIYENTTGAERTMDVVFYAFAESNNAKGYFTLHIVQPKASVFSVASTVLNVEASATSATINLSADVEWTATVTSGAATLNTASGNSDAAITVSFDENLDPDNAKHYEVTISSPGKTDIVVRINQAAAGGGSGNALTYIFETLNYGPASGSSWGIGYDQPVTGRYIDIKNISRVDGATINFEAERDAIVAEAISITDADGNPLDPSILSFPYNFMDGNIVVCGFKTGSTAVSGAIVTWYSSDGTALTETGHWTINIP